jgi:hypothetical protein
MSKIANQFAAIVCTVVVSATMLFGAVAPATAFGTQPITSVSARQLA